jgi:hypothetical protein
VIARWTQLFSGGVLLQCYLAGQCHTKSEVDKVFEQVSVWRDRLLSLMIPTIFIIKNQHLRYAG